MSQINYFTLHPAPIEFAFGMMDFFSKDTEFALSSPQGLQHYSRTLCAAFAISHANCKKSFEHISMTILGQNSTPNVIILVRMFLMWIR